ncbi:sensor histidine kinase [Pendulispora albinea]|uniref:Histidine kinase n=1 Tax=Pendulispora albinea TaxID=2741071 RepID=A0ABZ2MCE7_9BACT
MVAASNAAKSARLFGGVPSRSFATFRVGPGDVYDGRLPPALRLDVPAVGEHRLTGVRRTRARRAYWLAQLGGWFAYALVHYLSYMPALAPGEYLEYLGYSGLVATEVLYIPLGIAASTVLGLLYGRLLARQTPWFAIALGAVFGCAVLGMGFFLGYRVLLLWFDLLAPGEAFLRWPTAARSVLAFTFALLAWSGAWFGVVLWQASQASQLLAQEAKLQMLAYQLNPHFLFNALNSLRAMIDEDRVRARRMVTELAEFLRYTLVHRPLEHTTLAEEIEAIENYLAIEKIRFEDRLAAAIEIDRAVAGAGVPAFLLHPLVENALRHGSGGSPGRPLHVRVGARTEADRLVLEVWNSGTLRPASVDGHGGALVPSDGHPAGGTRIGLANVRARLDALFPGQHRFTLAEVGGGVLARIELPLART